MSFIKRDIKDRVVEYPRRYQLVEVSQGVYDLVPVTGVVIEEGTPVNKELLQRYEDGISDLGAEVDEHLEDTANPHSVTKTQVGLGSVENYAVSTREEAEAGTASNKYMTPERVKQAINALSPTTVIADIILTEDTSVIEVANLSNYSYLKLILHGGTNRSDLNGIEARVRFNDATSGYWNAGGTITDGIFVALGSRNSGSQAYMAVIDINNKTNLEKAFSGLNAMRALTPKIISGLWSNAAIIDKITITNASDLNGAQFGVGTRILLLGVR